MIKSAGPPPHPDAGAGLVGLASTPRAGLGVIEATELQDHLLTTFNDLERLQRLLDGMCDSLLGHFSSVNQQIEALVRTEGAGTLPPERVQAIRQELAGAITGLQFQDMGTQLITHTLKRLRNCADRLAQGALSDDEDGAGLIEEAPNRPNPVTQDEMDAGSVELF